MEQQTVADFSFAEAVFYGFKIDALAGTLSLDIINDGSVIELPTEVVDHPDDYKTWIWTKNTLQFSWSASKNTHLLMEIK